MNQYLSLGIFLLAVVAASAAGTSFEAGAWYQAMSKPGWTPADWLFGPIWALVYVLMAAAAWRLWQGGHSMRAGAVIWWLLVLVLTVAWSWLLFGLHRTGWAFMLSALSLALAIMCWRAFFLLSPRAGLLLTPMVIWLAFLAAFNYTVWSMNLGGLGRLFS